MFDPSQVSRVGKTQFDMETGECMSDIISEKDDHEPTLVTEAEGE